MAAPLKQAFVLIGTQGSGKSATGNSIIGTTSFKSKSGTIPLTTEIKEETLHWQSRDIAVIDTPPLNEISAFRTIKNHARTNYTHTNYGFVISIGRLDEKEPVLLEEVWKRLDPKQETMLLIFTRYDDLDANQSFKSWLKSCPKINAFIKKTKVECFPFANKNGQKPIKDQVNDLMSTIMCIAKEVKHEECQANVKLLANVDTTNKVKLAEMQESLKLQSKTNDEIPVSCETLEKYFGKYGHSFYNEVLKKGTK